MTPERSSELTGDPWSLPMTSAIPRDEDAQDGSRDASGRVGVAAALLAVAAAVTLASCGSNGSHRTPTFTGHSRAATVVLAVVARRPEVTAWQLSVRFTDTGAPLRRKVEQQLLNAFCISGRTVVVAGIGPSDLRRNAVEVPRFLNLPEPQRWVCGIRDSNPAKNRAEYIATALLAVTLTRS